MRYRVLNINKYHNGWKYYSYVDKEDRKEVPTVPNVLGFYYYPENLDEEIGFQELKQSMIDIHQKEIDRLLRPADWQWKKNF